MTLLIQLAAPALTFLLLLAVGLDLTANDFARVRRQPALVLTGLFAPLLILPPIAIAVTAIVRAPAEATMAMLLVASCPIGGISNTFSYLAGASTALSVTLTGLSCLCAVVTIPLLGKAFEHVLGAPFEFEAPGAVLAVQLVLLFALPLALGFLVRRRSPGIAIRHHQALQRLSFGSVGLVLAVVVLNDVKAFLASWSASVPLAALFVVSATAAGWLIATVVTRNGKDRFTLAVEFGTRNIAIATAIAVSMLGRIEFARFAATYFLIEFPLMIALVLVFRPRFAREP